MKLFMLTLFIGMTFAMLNTAQACCCKPRDLQAINQEEMAYMQPGGEIDYVMMQDHGDNDNNVAKMDEEEVAYLQPGGETNYCQRALMQDDNDVDVAMMVHWIVKWLKNTMRLAKLQDQSKVQAY